MFAESLNVSFIWPIDRTQSDAKTLGQNGPGSNGNKGVLHIFQISNTRASLSDCLTSYPGHSLGYVQQPHLTELASIYSATLLLEVNEIKTEPQLFSFFFFYWILFLISLVNKNYEANVTGYTCINILDYILCLVFQYKILAEN